MEWRLLLVGAAAVAATGCFYDCPPDPDRTRGILEARRDIAVGTPRLLFIGRPASDLSPLDPETGLLRKSVGCVLTKATTTYVAAYNETIRRALARGRIGRGRYKHKVLTRKAVEAAFAAGPVKTLRLGGPAVIAPTRRFAVALAPKEAARYLWRVSPAGERVPLSFVGGDEAAVTFTHEGTTLLVRDDRFRRYLSVDLESAVLLQVFPDPKQP